MVAGEYALILQHEPLFGHDVFGGAALLDEETDLVVAGRKLVTSAGKQVAAAVELRIAQIVGHKTLAMTKRYTHLRAKDLARLLD